jgi:hypothetical protein
MARKDPAMRPRDLRLIQWLWFLALAGGLAETAAAAPAKRAVIVAWDGAADWVVERLLAEGRLPNVARLARMGARAEYVIPAWPSKIAAGFAALWTGAYGDVNRITGNGVPLLPRAEHTLLEDGWGLDGELQGAETLGDAAVQAGKRIVRLSMPCAGPTPRWLRTEAGSRVPKDRYVVLGSFGQRMASRSRSSSCVKRRRSSSVARSSS